MDVKVELEHTGLRIFELAANTSDELHGHGCYYQISVPLSGAVSFQFNQRVRSMDINQRLIVSPSDRHCHIAHDQPVRIMLISAHEDFLRKELEERVDNAPDELAFIPWVEGATEQFRKLAETLFALAVNSSSDLLAMQEFERKLAEVFLSLHAGTHSAVWSKQRENLPHPALCRVVEYIRDAYGDDLSLDRLAQCAGVNKFHLIALFQRHLGQTPSLYVNEVRLEQARQLLQRTSQDITAIAYEVGFGSLSTFQRAFKKKFGVSAREYRRML